MKRPIKHAALYNHDSKRGPVIDAPTPTGTTHIPLRVQDVQLAIPDLEVSVAPNSFLEPAGYRGLHAFHKYWGKKPPEPLAYLIEQFSPKKGLVCDPFMGTGTGPIEACRKGRRAIGIDVNPIAVRIAALLMSPPRADIVTRSLKTIADEVKREINATYTTRDSRTATHFVWTDDKLEKIWIAGGRSRTEFTPTADDLTLAFRYEGYLPTKIRTPRFFTNSRINSAPSLTLRSLFRGRAIRNIELIMSAIDALPQEAQEAMRLSLTASIGQMSKMVFAITRRGKATERSTDRMEVGSWVIGYWRPLLHFEINVWNCFERRVKKLVTAVNEHASEARELRSGSISEVVDGSAQYAFSIGDSLAVTNDLRDQSVDLILTDPPHSDRIPYLELSELWNAVLDEKPCFDSEIVVSNAKERHKTTNDYANAMSRFFQIASKKLKPQGILIFFFNARSKTGWRFIEEFLEHGNEAGLTYCGCCPLVYSAASVVQDNRAGALCGDYGLLFSVSKLPDSRFTGIPGWSPAMPLPSQ